MKYITDSPEETLGLGYKFGRELKPGSVVALIGELGSGKTTFTKGVAKGLDVKEYEYVNSPSFVILKEYFPKGGAAFSEKSKKMPLYHFDFYRLDSNYDLETVGYEEYLYSKGISVIEWADRATGILPEKYICVKFKHLGKDKREIIIDEGEMPKDGG